MHPFAKYASGWSLTSLILVPIIALGCRSATTSGAGGAPATSGAGSKDEDGDHSASGMGGAGKAGQGGTGGRSVANIPMGNPGSVGMPSVKGTVVTSVNTALPSLPPLRNVEAWATDDNVSITFFPVDDAVDYRVYELPNDSDVSADSDGRVTVKNALYRCAGDRQTPATLLDGEAWPQSTAIMTLVEDQDVLGYTRKLSDATLGYVYVTPGPDRVPVYALGDPRIAGDNDCFSQRWAASRVKRYVTSEAERQSLVSKRWRDDGIAFYVPAEAGSGTRAVYTAMQNTDAYLYFTEGPELAVRNGKQTAFDVLTDGSKPDTLPLMRVFYWNRCGDSHDELVAGPAQFERARYQGDKTPVFGLHWAGMTKETTLVVEALADGCPYQGVFAPHSSPGYDAGNGLVYEAWKSFDEIKKASPTGEVYLNGQHDAATRPRPIARSFVQIAPSPPPNLDWFAGFATPDAIGEQKALPCGVIKEGQTCWAQTRTESPLGDFQFQYVEDKRHGMTSMFGELWVGYSDVGADVNGKFRLTAAQKAEMRDDSFLYVTMTVDSFTTGRRYPQIIISDQGPPVQYNMELGYALVLQSFVDWPNWFQIELCDHKYWDVNTQCPAFDLHHLFDPNDPSKMTGYAPHAEFGESIGMDRSTHWELYASTRRAYVMLDGQPYGCADFTKQRAPSGPVTVTFGDVLYHSGVDRVFSYTAMALQTQTRRHFDNLGFKSGVAEPEWDEALLPCVTKMIQQ
jgi:hypothetical protein